MSADSQDLHQGLPDPLRPSQAAAGQPLPAQLQAWRERLQAVGVSCKDIAYAGLSPWGDRRFAGVQAQAVWETLLPRLGPQQPVALSRSGNDLVMACLMSGADGETAAIACLVAPPHNEKAIQLIQLSLGWLQYAVSAESMARSAHAARLLELLGHVMSQHGARAAAQEWINRCAAWARAEHADAQGIALTLFSVTRSLPKWWVSSDTAWVEPGAPAVKDAQDLAVRAAVEMQEQVVPGWWALPLLDAGEVTAVLVVRGNDLLARTAAPESGSSGVPLAVAELLRGCGAMSEPLLRRWRDAERPVWRHALDALGDARRKITGPGYLTWKAAAAVLLLTLGVLTLWPVEDRVKANVVIEGSTRQVVTAPFEGFIVQVAARPGDQVRRGQLLARLDDRDLLLERAKQQSAADQAEGRLRQAMGEREGPAMAQASAELRQAQAQLALVEAKLARSSLSAPLDGVVVTGDWAQQLGAPVENGKELFEIAAVQSYRVVLHVADNDIARVHAGQAGALRLTGQPDRSHAFRIVRVTATASVREGTNGFRVEAEWTGKAPLLSPGMQGVGKIAVGETNLLTAWTRPLVDWLRLKLWGWW